MDSSNENIGRLYGGNYFHIPVVVMVFLIIIFGAAVCIWLPTICRWVDSFFAWAQ